MSQAEYLWNYCHNYAASEQEGAAAGVGHETQWIGNSQGDDVVADVDELLNGVEEWR